VREREEANRTRKAGHLDEIQGVVANTLNLLRIGAVGFIGWLDRSLVSVEYWCDDTANLVVPRDPVFRIKNPVFARIAGVAR
jgi:hypothetical protein